MFLAKKLMQQYPCILLFFVAAISSGNLLPGNSVFTNVARADDDVPFIDNFQIPAAQPGDLVLNDEDLLVTDAQAQVFGNTMLQSEAMREAVRQDVFKLAALLKDKLEKVIPELGEKLVKDIKAALAMPESREKKWRLSKLNAKSIMKNPNWDSKEGIETLGEVLFLARVDKGGNWIDDFRVVVKGLGFAEPKLVDGELYPRMVDERTGSSHMIIRDELEIEKVPFQRYNARVRAWANHGRGRPVVYWSVHDPEVDMNTGSPDHIRVKFYDRPKGIKNRLTNWWKACWVKPDAQAFAQGGIKTAFEVGSAELLTYLISGGHVDHTFIELTTGYALVLGIFGSTVRNMLSPVDPSNAWERLYKMSLRLLITSYSFGAWNKALRNGIGSISWFTVSGRAMNVDLIKNSIASNLLKDGFNSLNDIREATGHARYTIPIGSVNLKGTQFERTAWYQIPNNLKNADLLTLSTPNNGLPHFLFYSAIVATPIAVYEYAKRIKYEKAEALPAGRVFNVFKQMRESYLKSEKSGLGAIMDVLGDFTGRGIGACKKFCCKLMTKTPEEVHTMAPPFDATLQGEWVDFNLNAPQVEE